MTAREALNDFAGRVCRVAIPIREEYYHGKGGSIAICTLSSLELLTRVSKNPRIMDRIAIVGRLLSENKGIDKIISYASEHPELERILLCGKEVKGHHAGQALVALAANGFDPIGRIIGAIGPHPKLRSSKEEIDRFRTNVKVIDCIGMTDIERIEDLVS